MNTSKLKVGVEAKTARVYCHGLITEHFEQALVEQQLTEILSSSDGKIKIMQTLVICVD